MHGLLMADNLSWQKQQKISFSTSCNKVLCLLSNLQHSHSSQRQENALHLTTWSAKLKRSSVFSLNVAKMAPIPSDHFPIIATLRIHFARIECSQLDPKPGLSYFASPENCQRFAQKFQNISSYTEFSAAFDVAKQSTSHRTWKTDVAKKVMAMNNNIGLDGRILSNFLEAQDSAQVTLFVHHYSSMLRQNPRLAWDFVRRSMFRSPSSTFPAATQEERLSKLTAHFRTLFSSDGGPGPPNWGYFLSKSAI